MGGGGVRVRGGGGGGRCVEGCEKVSRRELFPAKYKFSSTVDGQFIHVSCDN